MCVTVLSINANGAIGAAATLVAGVDLERRVWGIGTIELFRLDNSAAKHPVTRTDREKERERGRVGAGRQFEHPVSE